MNNMVNPRPGWYPNPDGTPSQRYWDGTQWGDPRPYPQAEPAKFTIHYGFALIALISLGVTLLFGLPMIASGSDPEGGGDIAAGLGGLWILWGLAWTAVWSAFAVQHTLRGKR